MSYYYYRKNFSSGALAIQLIDSPGYPDDPLYDEIALEEDHTLPDATEAELTDQFRLVIWSETINPGDDPSMEIVTATRTSHPRVYQIVTRGEENTDIVAHPVGSYVGLHYTAGLSELDMAPVNDILAASAGSLIYVWVDIFGNKSIEILSPGSYGQVLVTAGSNERPFWDWAWLAPGAAYGAIKAFYHEVLVGVAGSKITIDESESLLATSFATDISTDSQKIDEQVSYDVDSEMLIFDGSSGSEQFVDAPSTLGKLETDVVTALV